MSVADKPAVLEVTGVIDPAGTPAEESVPGNLDGLSDEELRALSLRAAEIVAEREKAQREQAIKQIQSIAKEHGLKVTVQDPSKKRGRPPKPKPAG